MNQLIKVNPPFKYIGGKSWLQKELSILVKKQLAKNCHIDTYCEPFCGGLGAFLNIYHILLENNIKNIILNDINSNMINLYKYIANDIDTVIENMQTIELLFENTIDIEKVKKTKSKDELKLLLKKANEFFLEQRKIFNKNKRQLNQDQAVKFLFLQKHSFNGIYRENGKGEYNSPFNWSEKIINEDYIKNLYNLNHLFNKFKINFTNISFEDIEYSRNMLVYLDPPYINLDIQENSYNKNRFGLIEQKKLIQLIKNSTFIYSNHNHQDILNEFNVQKITINTEIISRSNLISAKADSRKNKKEELLIHSF